MSSEVTTEVVVNTECQPVVSQCICDPDCPACRRTVRCDCVCKMKEQDPIRVPWYSKAHPMIPRRYVQPWTQDMVNRSIIYHNAKKGGIPTYEHDDALYLNKREQLKYNVQNRRDVDARYQLPDRETMMCTVKDDPSNKYFSAMLARHPK